MKWLETSKSKLVKETGGNEPHLEVFKVLFIHCNIVNNNYLQHSRVWYIFVPNKSFCQLLDISPNIYIYIFFKKNFAFSYIEVWFTDQNYKPRDKG